MFYHVSKVDLGEVVTLKAKVPETSVISVEGSKPRVCFSPTINQCLHAIQSATGCTHAKAVDELLPFNWKEQISNPVVYFTEKKLFKPSKKISDFAITEEHWSLKDIEVKRVGYIDLAKYMFEFSFDEIPMTDENYSKVSEDDFKLWKYMMHLNSKRVVN